MRLGCVFSGLMASVLAFLSIVSTQAMTGNESGMGLTFGYTLGWFLLFGLAATLPEMGGANERRSVERAFLAYGIGGGVGGAIIGALLVTGTLGGSFGAILGAFAVPFLVPWIVGSLITSWISASNGRG